MNQILHLSKKLVSALFGFLFKKRKDIRTYKPKESKNDSHFSSDTQEKAGDEGEFAFQVELERLKMHNLIDGFIKTRNIYFNGENFEIDFLIFVKNFGLIVAEVKYYSGTVRCTSEHEWVQIKPNGEEFLTRNASRQANRAAALLRKLLESKGQRWHTKQVVIFTHDNGKIFTGSEEKGLSPQTDILKISLFEDWLAAIPRKRNSYLTRTDCDVITRIIRANEREYQKPAA